jgi:HSP20 family protein
MTPVRFDPFREMTDFRRTLERFFDEPLLRRELPIKDTNYLAPMPIDVFEEGEKLIVKAWIPGLKPEEIKLNVVDNVLFINGLVKYEEEKTERTYYLREFVYNRFERSVRLPFPVVVDKIEAFFENGLLTIALPKVAEFAPKVIEIKTQATPKVPKA